MKLVAPAGEGSSRQQSAANQKRHDAEIEVLVQQQWLDGIDIQILHRQVALVFADFGEPQALLIVVQYKVVPVSVESGEEVMNGDDLARNSGNDQIIADTTHALDPVTRQANSNDRGRFQRDIARQDLADFSTTLGNHFQRKHFLFPAS
nr:hypothetical protein [Variovorax paradoxus]